MHWLRLLRIPSRRPVRGVLRPVDGSGGDGDCVEVALTPASIHVRDTKNRRGPGSP
ncbi:DUF397 domain-containing protein [Streptomyces sp. NPDC001982]|uniref:DUF397 domain-containing protein n=1 Tax=Streptomyces sp. NPDC001982 TaxID=3154405 RepID=UPI00332AF2D2